MRVKSILCILVAVSLFALTACSGNSDTDSSSIVSIHDVEELEEELSYNEDENEFQLTTKDLNGIWQSVQEYNGYLYEIVLEHDDFEGYVAIFKEKGDDISLYWVGSFLPFDQSIYNYEWTSERYPMQEYGVELELDFNSLIFHYQGGYLRFNLYDDEGNAEETIWFFKTNKIIPKAENEEDNDEARENPIESEEPVIEIHDDNVVPFDDDTKDTTTLGNNDTNTTCSHVYNVGAVTKYATCTEPGTKTYTCTKCGATMTEQIPATGHNYQENITKIATCSTDGIKTMTCLNCGDVYQTTIPATGEHNWVAIYTTNETEDEGHYETVTVSEAEYKDMYQCSVCSMMFDTVDQVNNHIATAHPDSNATYSKESTLVKDAVTEEQWVVDKKGVTEQIVDHYECSVCGETKD